MKKRLRIILPLVLAVVVIISLYRYFSVSGDDGVIRFSGNIEATEVQMSFRIPGLMEERLVEEGDTVEQGQILARLDTGDQVIAAAQAEARVRYAKEVLAELENGSRQEEIDRSEAHLYQARYALDELQNGSRNQDIESAKAQLESAAAAEMTAQVQLDQARNDYERYTKLYKNGSVSLVNYEKFKTEYETVESRTNEIRARTKVAREQLDLLETGARIEQVKKAEAALKQAEAEYALVKKGPRMESIEQAKAQLQIARAGDKQARLQLVYTEMTAPLDGVVLSTSAEAGEYLNPASPVLTLGKLDKLWLRAFIHEKDLGRIKLNQEVSVKTDSYPGKLYKGKVSYISSQAEFTPKIVQTFEERVKLMYRIKVDLDNPDFELKPGMPADGVVTLAP